MMDGIDNNYFWVHKILFDLHGIHLRPAYTNVILLMRLSVRIVLSVSNDGA